MPQKHDPTAKNDGDPAAITVLLNPWALEEENHKKYAAGSESKFALDCLPINVTVDDDNSTLGLSRLDLFRYEMSSKVVHKGHNLIVIDCGLFMAYISSLVAAKFPENVERGNRLRGQVDLEVDPNIYRNTSNNEDGVPPLIYSWRIKRVRAIRAGVAQGYSDMDWVAFKRAAKIDEVLLASSELASSVSAPVNLFALDIVRLDSPPTRV